MDEEIIERLADVERQIKKLVKKMIKELFEMNDRCFFIGGDNSINYSLIKGFDKVVNGLLVVFDAHTNCDENGWIRRLIEGGFNGRRVILIGCRNIGDNELKFIKEEEINLIRMDVLNEDLEGVCDMVMGRVKDSKGFYVNFSLNCIDPGFAPGVCCLESGGISANDSLYFVKRLKLLQNFRGLGVVNLNPSKDFNRMSINLGARLLGSSILYQVVFFALLLEIKVNFVSYVFSFSVIFFFFPSGLTT